MADISPRCSNHVETFCEKYRIPSGILELLISRDCLDCVKCYILFCEKGNIKIKFYPNERGYIPIHFAIFKERMDMFEFLIPFCSLEDLTRKSPKTGDTLLHFASKSENPEYLKILLGLILEKGLIPKDDMFRDFLGYTPLYYTIYSDNIENVELLLKIRFLDGFRFNINDVDFKGNSILHMYVQNYWPNRKITLEFLVEELSQDGIYLDLNIRNQDGKTALDVATYEEDIEYLTKISSLTKTKKAKGV